MTSFVLQERDLFFISLGVNIQFVFQHVLGRMLSLLLTVVKSRSSMAYTLSEIDLNRPGLLGRLLAEQALLLTTVILSVSSTNFTTLTSSPFSHQPDPQPELFIRLTLCFNAARCLANAVRLAFVRDLVLNTTEQLSRSVASKDQTGNWSYDLFYNIFTLTSSLLHLGYRENLFMGVTSVLMELNTTPLQCARLIRLAKEPFHAASNWYRKTTILCFVTCVVCRLCVPIILVTVSLHKESPFVMSNVMVAWFFLSAVVYSVFNLVVIYQSTKRLLVSVKQTIPFNSPHCGPPRQPVSIYEYPNMLSNDIRDTVKGKIEGGENVKSRTLKNFDYVFLRPFDNRNVTSVLYNGGEDEKSNTFNRKDTSKHTLLFKERLTTKPKETPEEDAQYPLELPLRKSFVQFDLQAEQPLTPLSDIDSSDGSQQFT